MTRLSTGDKRAGSALTLDLTFLRNRARSRRAAVKDGLNLAGLIAGVFMVWHLQHLPDPFGGDAHGYWDFTVATLYHTAYVGPAGTFMRYGPPVALAFVPLHLLPYQAYLAVWVAFLLLVLAWIARDWTPFTLGLLPVVMEIYFGNVDLLIAAAIVLGFRYPATWSFVLLTKVTPGIGLLWFAVRREWRNLAIACVATAALVVASAVMAPYLWPKWIALLTESSSVPVKAIPIPLILRLPVALAVVAGGALTGKRWMVPVAATIALPVLWWEGLSILVAVIPLARQDASPIMRVDRWRARSLPGPT